jgi:hypothetical protein
MLASLRVPSIYTRRNLLGWNIVGTTQRVSAKYNNPSPTDVNPFQQSTISIFLRFLFLFETTSQSAQSITLLPYHLMPYSFGDRVNRKSQRETQRKRKTYTELPTNLLALAASTADEGSVDQRRSTGIMRIARQALPALTGHHRNDARRPNRELEGQFRSRHLVRQRDESIFQHSVLTIVWSSRRSKSSYRSVSLLEGCEPYDLSSAFVYTSCLRRFDPDSRD